MVSRFEYSVRDCDCCVCAHKTRKKRCGSNTGCVCLRERLVADCVPLVELMAVLTAEVAVPAFVSRVSHLSQQSGRLFRDEPHRQRFETARERKLTETPPQMAAVYLLTADPYLWSKAQMAVTAERINFTAMHIHGVDLDGYVLFHTAKNLYSGSKHISLSELTDPELV